MLDLEEGIGGNGYDDWRQQYMLSVEVIIDFDAI